MCFLLTLSMSSLFLLPSGSAKVVLIEFRDKQYSANTSLWEEFLFPISNFFTQRPICHILEPCCSEAPVSKQRLVFVDFKDDTVFFFSLILLEIKIVTYSYFEYPLLSVGCSLPNLSGFCYMLSGFA